MTSKATTLQQMAAIYRQIQSLKEKRAEIEDRFGFESAYSIENSVNYIDRRIDELNAKYEALLNTL